MKQWQYMTTWHAMDLKRGPNYPLSFLSEQGKQGWRLVARYPLRSEGARGVQYIFTRPFPKAKPRHEQA